MTDWLAAFCGAAVGSGAMLMAWSLGGHPVPAGFGAGLFLTVASLLALRPRKVLEGSA